MARPWRIQYPGAVYHVMSRGNNRQAIFLSDADRLDFLDLLGKAAERFQLQIFSFCLMNNHYHLFLRTPQPNLSQALQWLNTTYTVRFLRRHRRSGHFFQGRFKGILVENAEHWEHLSIYLHLNPVRAGLVHDPGEYEWSSYRDFIRFRNRFPWLCREEILSYYRGSKISQRRAYRRDCLGTVEEEDKFWDRFRGTVIGSREFLAEMVSKFAPRGDQEEVTEYQQSRKRELNLERELGRVAKTFKVSIQDLKSRRRNFPARLALYYHLVEHCGMTGKEVGRMMGVSGCAVSLGIKSLKSQMAENRRLRRKVNSLTFN